jgi:dolichol-phosphate mannosyltransferase
MNSNTLISVVVPVYNEAKGISHFHERASAALRALGECDYELVYVDDGSRDTSYDIMCGFADRDHGGP